MKWNRSLFICEGIAEFIQEGGIAPSSLAYQRRVRHQNVVTLKLLVSRTLKFLTKSILSVFTKKQGMPYLPSRQFFIGELKTILTGNLIKNGQILLGDEERLP